MHAWKERKNQQGNCAFQAESRADELSKTQISFKRALIRDIRDFSKDVTKFRADFVRDGPMVQVRTWRHPREHDGAFARSMNNYRGQSMLRSLSSAGKRVVMLSPSLGVLM